MVSNMGKIEDILSRQDCVIRFENGIVDYFSISTQHCKANTLQEAVNNIIDADKKYNGMSGLHYLINEMEKESDKLLYKEDK